MKNYYHILGVDSKASEEEIKKAYRILAPKYHPDSGNAKMVSKFQELTEAYKCLLDKERRQEHDLELQNKEKTSAVSTISPPQTGLYKKRISPEREKELKQFHRKKFLKAIFKVSLTVLIFFAAGFLLAWALKGYRWVGAILAGLSGLFLGLNGNFDLESFILSAKSQKIFKRVTWCLYAMTIIYFLFWTIKLFLSK